MSDDFMLTAEERRLKRVKRRRIIVGLHLVVLVVVFAFLEARPARDAIKGWQARRHATKAFAFIDQEKWSEARDEALAGYQLRPTEPQTLRAVARFLSRTRQAEALEFWKKLDAQHLMTRADRRDQVAIALAADDPATAEMALNDLLARKDVPPSPPDFILAAQVAILKNSPGEAKTFASKVLDDPGADERSQFQAALIILNLGGRENSDATAPAWVRLKKLAEGQTKTSLDALVMLAQRALSIAPNSSEARDVDIPALANALENHPLATPAHKLLAVDLQIHLDPSQRDALIQRTVERWKNADTPSLVSLATWLNGKGEFQLHLDSIPLKKALQNRDLFLQHVDSLGALGHWEEIRQLLEAERFPLDQAIMHMYLARCYSQLNQKTASENNWKRALEAAAGDAGKLMTLAEYAEKNGAGEIAEAAYTNAASVAPRQRLAQQGRLRFAQAKQDTKKIHAVLADMLAAWPHDAAIQNDEAYTRLLLLPNESVDSKALSDIADRAEALVKRNPSSLPHRTLLALSRLRQNRTEDALRVYDNLSVDPRVLTPSALAVHAAILKKTGHAADAETELEKVPVDRLLPEERELIGKSVP